MQCTFRCRQVQRELLSRELREQFSPRAPRASQEKKKSGINLRNDACCQRMKKRRSGLSPGASKEMSYRSQSTFNSLLSLSLSSFSQSRVLRRLNKILATIFLIILFYCAWEHNEKYDVRRVSNQLTSSQAYSLQIRTKLQHFFSFFLRSVKKISPGRQPLKFHLL